MLESFRIVNVKGIVDKTFKVELQKNGTLIVYGPNGSGKTSISTAFSLIKGTGLKINKNNKNIFLKETEESFIEITIDNKKYTISESKNNLHKDYDVEVIKNLVKPSVVKVGDNRHDARNVIKNLDYICNIPKNIKYNYKFTETKEALSINNNLFNKLAFNFTNVISNEDIIKFLYKNKDEVKPILKLIGFTNIINELNKEESSYTKKDFIKLFENTYYEQLLKIPRFNKIDSSFKTTFQEKYSKLAVLNIIFLFNEIADLNKIYDRYNYDNEIKYLKEFINSISCRKNVVSLEKKKDKLYFKFADLNTISDGQRDILTFFCQLELLKRKTIGKKDIILIIDEIADYMDAVNMLLINHFLSDFISSCRKEGVNVYTLIMTHLDNKIYKLFVNKSLKYYYLYNNENIGNSIFKNIIINREAIDKRLNTIYGHDILSHCYLHYSPVEIKIDELIEEYKLPASCFNKKAFESNLFSNINKYINNKKAFTLIELLAVILILGIIALIAIPTVNKVLEEAKVSSFETTLNNISKKVEETCSMELIKGESITNKYTISGGVPSPSLELKGALPDGELLVDNNCRVTYTLSNNNYVATKNNPDDKVVIEKCNGSCVKYSEALLNGATPEVDSGMIPATLELDGTVKKADLFSK